MSKIQGTGSIKTGLKGVGGQDSNPVPAQIPVDVRTKVQMYSVLGALNTLRKCSEGDILEPTAKFAFDEARVIYERMEAVRVPIPADAVFTLMECHELLDRLLGAGLLALSSKAEAERLRTELRKFFPPTISNQITEHPKDGGNDAA